MTCKRTGDHLFSTFSDPFRSRHRANPAWITEPTRLNQQNHLRTETVRAESVRAPNLMESISGAAINPRQVRRLREPEKPNQPQIAFFGVK